MRRPVEQGERANLVVDEIITIMSTTVTQEATTVDAAPRSATTTEATPLSKRQQHKQAKALHRAGAGSTPDAAAPAAQTNATGNPTILLPLDVTDLNLSAARTAAASDRTAAPAPCLPLARSTQELADLSEALAGGITAFRDLPIAHLKRYIYVVTRVADLAAANIAAMYPSLKEEFVVCAMYAPQLVDAAVRLGLLPMTISLCKSLPEFLAPKLHAKRCVVRLAPDMALPDGVRKKAKKFALVVDGGMWDVCLAAIVAQAEASHGHCWVNEHLAKAYAGVNTAQPGTFATGLHCISVVHAADVPALAAARAAVRDLSRAVADAAPSAAAATTLGAQLAEAKRKFHSVAQAAFAAGELGTSCGGIYTSLTGGYTVSGAGSVQLGVLGALLVRCGYRVWDLGMSMTYKQKSLGGSDVSRAEWLRLAADVGGMSPMRGLTSLDGYVVRADLLIDAALAAPCAAAAAPASAAAAAVDAAAS